MTTKTTPIILCVDDEKDITDSLFYTFMDTYDIKTANSGAEALKIFDKYDVQLIISDQRMPEMTGTELLAQINEKKPFCKKILLTGYTDNNASIDAINKCSVDKYVSKPWDYKELIREVKRLVGAYEFDLYLHNMVKKSERILKERDETKQQKESYESFLDSYLIGICVVEQGNEIDYINKTGLKILKLKDMSQAKGKNFNELFLLDDSKLNEFHDRYLRKDLNPYPIDVQLFDNSKISLPLRLTFNEEAHQEKMQVSGIMFTNPSPF